MAGLATAFGSGAMTNSIADIEESDCIFITGSNTTSSHPIIADRVYRAKEHGARVIVADPRRIHIARIADVHVQQRLGTDVALLNGIMHVILERGWQDQEFIDQRCEGFEALRDTVKKYPPSAVEEITGVSATDIERIAETYAGAKTASILYCMGITQHTTGVDNVKSLANLAMLTGNMGRPGTGVNPLRGQNNVQGACDMGGLPNVYTGYQKVTDEAARTKMEKAWGVSGLPDKPGLTVTHMVPKAYEGVLKAMYIIGENPLVSDPDLNHAEKSFSRLNFLVVQDIFMTETAREADVVLPSTCFAEKEGTFSNTERRVQRVRKALAPPGSAREDWRITAEIARRMGYPMDYDSAREIFAEITRVTPSYAGISYERIEREGLHWPCPTQEHPGTPILHTQQFTHGKGVFHAIDFIPPAEQVDAEYPLYLTTGRLLYQYHTGTMTRRTEGLNERAPESFVEISSADAEKNGLRDGEKIRIASRRGEITARVKVSDLAVDGTVFIPFHFAEAAANRLTNAALDPVANIPEYKVCAVKIEQAA